MNKTNNTTHSGGIFVKVALLAALFLGAVTGVWALPGTGSTNLQTTAGVAVATNGNTLTVTAPNKSVLTWQNFGSGTDAIGLGDTIAYTLPDSRSSVLNIVAGGARTTIDGAISSNGNVFVLNPNGIVVGNGARFDTNAVYLSTSDNTAFANYYFQQNGKLPSQAGLAPAAGTTTIGNSTIINVTDNITILSKNVDVGGALIQGGLNIVADGAVVVGSNGLTYALGAVTIDNPTGATTLGTAGNSFIANGNVTVNATTGTINNPAGTTFTAKSLVANAGTGDVTIGKVNSSAISVTGNNIALAVGSAVNPVVTATANGTVAITSPGTTTVNVANTSPTATTSVVAGGALTLGNVHVNSAGATTFTGTSVTDSVNNNFVYGPVLFNATAGDVSITKSGNSFGPVSVATVGTATATVNEGAALNLGTINTSKLTAKTGDYLFQTGVVTAPTLIATAVNDVTLGAVTNTIGSVTITGNNIALADTGAVVFNATGNNVALSTTGAVTLGNVTTGGTLAVTTTGAITQDATSKVKAVGATSLTGASLALVNTGNSFGALTVDTNTGAAAIAEETTLNLAGLRAGATTLSSNGSVITSGVAPINAATVTITAGADVTLGANFNSTGALMVNAANGTVDLSLLSFAGNLRSVFPAVVAKNYKAPTP